MDFDIEPQGKRSTVKITSRKYLGDSFLLLQCFENFLEFGLAAEVYNWQRDGIRIFYSLTTSGEKKGKVKLDASLFPVDDGIVLDTAVTNLDSKIVDHILYNTCLQFKHAPAFRDLDGERTFVQVDGKWASVLSLPCHVGPGHWRRMQNYYVKKHKPDELVNGFMGDWGFCPTPLSRAFMAKQSSENSLTIGIMWDRAFYARSNMNDSHHCIHSQAVLDDICPGDIRHRKGKIFFAPDGLDQLSEMASSFFGWRED